MDNARISIAASFVFLVLCISCASAWAVRSVAGVATLWEKGFAVDYAFNVLDKSLSKIAKLDTQIFTQETDITALQIAPERAVVGTSNRGIFESLDGGLTWAHADVQKIPMLEDSENQRRVYAFDNTASFATQKHDVLLRPREPGHAWQPLKTNLRRSVIYTSIHRGKNSLFVGTSVNGLSVAPLSDAALQKAQEKKQTLSLKFHSLNSGLPGKRHDSTLFIYEEIQTIYETDAGDLLVATGPRPAVFVKKKNSNRFQEIKVDGLNQTMDECPSLTSAQREQIVLSCRRGVWVGSPSSPQWEFTPQEKILPDIKTLAAYSFINTNGNAITYWKNASHLTDAKKARMKNSENQRLLYSSPFTWHKKKAKVLSELSHDFWTGLVIDGKDDFGIIRFDSQVPLARAIGAVRPLYKLADVVRDVHALKKRVVVRLVVFKDPKLFEREGYAIRDAGGGKWIGSPKERWVDPYNPNLISEYYAPLVKEITAAGVDEIQLDYIRFPSDGAIGRCRYSHKKSEHYASEALENFLAGVRAQTDLPLGADIYGYNGMYRVPGSIGQDAEVYGKILDVISPMHYSSHFGNDYMREFPRDERAYRLLYLALSRGTFYAHGNFVIRPYLQAFPMKNGIWGYGKKYFADQIKGSADGGGSGFMFWGMLDHMILVRKTQTE